MRLGPIEDSINMQHQQHLRTADDSVTSFPVGTAAWRGGSGRVGQGGFLCAAPSSLRRQLLPLQEPLLLQQLLPVVVEAEPVDEDAVGAVCHAPRGLDLVPAVLVEVPVLLAWRRMAAARGGGDVRDDSASQYRSTKQLFRWRS